MASILFNYTIPFGASLQVGYRLSGSASPYTFLSTYPAYNQSPYTLTVPIAGLYDIELTTVCASCSGGNFSNSIVVTQVNAT